MTTDITTIFQTLVMESSVMNIHDFVGCNLIFTITTGNHVYIILDSNEVKMSIIILIILYPTFPLGRAYIWPYISNIGIQRPDLDYDIGNDI